MKYRLTIITPIKEFESLELPGEKRDEIFQLIVSAFNNELAIFHLETSDGIIFLGETMIKQSIFKLVSIE